MKNLFLLLFVFVYHSTIPAQDKNIGQRLVEKHQFNLIYGEAEKANTIVKYFTIPLKSESIFTTLALKFYHTALSDINLKIAYSEDGVTFTKWENLNFDPHVDAKNGFLVTNLTFIDETYSDVKVKVESNKLKNIDVEAHWFLPVQDFSLQKASLPNTNLSSTDCLLPTYVTRTGWNCPTGQDYSSGNPSFTNVSHLVVHHSAGSNSSSNWPAVVLSIWNFHRFTNGWSDIGYNALIDPNGVIYEGRGGNNGYSLDVTPAATCGSNSGTMAICLLGNFENATPSNAAVESLERFLAWKTDSETINPLGSSSLNNYGVLNHIFGHRQGCSTQCPGDNLFSELSNIRTSVNSLITNNCDNNSVIETTDFTIDDNSDGDSNGDDDGIIEIGETIEMFITASNTGNSTVNNITATLSTNNNCVTFIDDDISFGSISAGQDSTNGDFDFTITENCDSGTFPFFITYTADEGSWIDTIVLEIFNPCILPTVNFSATPLTGASPLTVVFNNETSNANSFSWEINGPQTIVSTLSNPSIELTESGIYNVELTAFNECGNTSLVVQDYIEVLEVTSIYSQALVELLYPNPTRDKLNIQLKRPLEKGTIEILNLMGQLMKEQSFSGNQIEVDVQNLVKGQYLIRLTNINAPEENFTISFVKSN